MGNMSAAKIKELQALVPAVKAVHEGKASEAQKDLVLGASPYMVAKARHEAKITSERARSHVSVTANGTNGFSLGWREAYGLKALADLLEGSITIKMTPKDKPDAKPVSVEKIQELMKLLAQVNSGDVEMTPNEAAAKVAGVK